MPTATYIPLQTITLGSSAASVTFGSIPNSYRDLVLVANNVGASTTAYMGIRINGISTGSYDSVRMLGFSSGTLSQSFTNQNSYDAGYMPPGTQRLFSIVQFFDASATDKQKTMLTRWNNMGESWVAASAGRLTSTNNAISTITVSPTDPNSNNPTGTFNSGSTFSLYGIAG